MISETLVKNDYSAQNPQEIEQNQAYFRKDNFSFKFKNEFEKMLSSFDLKKQELDRDEQINNLFLDLDFGAQFQVEARQVSEEDAMFFVNMLNQNGLVNYAVEGDNLEISTKNANKIQASSALLDMLKTSYDSKKPIRMDFDNNVTVILKLDDKGKINAHFIPGDKAVEEYLRNNISYLRQRFDEQNISYSNISYRQHKNQNENQKNKKENNQ